MSASLAVILANVWMKLSVKVAIDCSTQKVSESVTQIMIAWKTSSNCSYSAVKDVKDSAVELLDVVFNVHPNLQFTLEKNG